MGEVIEATQARLVEVLNGLDEGGEPHVVGVQLRGQKLRITTVTGALFEVWPAPAAAVLQLSTVERAAATRRSIWADEPYDVYRASGPDFVAVEVRSLAGESLLEVLVRTRDGLLRARVLQVDAQRWETEDDGLIGDGFEDFAERNALWRGLGGARPRGWELDVVEPGEAWPGAV